MIQREFRRHARAVPGKILVERDPMETQRHGLHVPKSFIDHTKKATGIVVDINEADAASLPYCVGEKVLLSASGGRQLVFGLGATDGESELWNFSAQSVKLVLRGEAKVDVQTESVLRHERHRLASQGTTTDGKWTEGDREGLR